MRYNYTIRPINPNEDVTRCREIIADCFDKSIVMLPVENELATWNSDAEFRKRMLAKERFCKGDWLERVCNHGDFYVIGEKNQDKILGMGALSGSEVARVYIDPDTQKGGIGTTMVNFLEELLRQRRVPTAQIFAFSPAETFWEKQGYELVSMNDYSYEQQGIVVRTSYMTKKL